MADSLTVRDAENKIDDKGEQPPKKPVEWVFAAFILVVTLLIAWNSMPESKWNSALTTVAVLTLLGVLPYLAWYFEYLPAKARRFLSLTPLAVFATYYGTLSCVQEKLVPFRATTFVAVATVLSEGILVDVLRRVVTKRLERGPKGVAQVDEFLPSYLPCLDHRLPSKQCDSNRACQPMFSYIDSQKMLCPARVYESVTTFDYSTEFTDVINRTNDANTWVSFFNRICDEIAEGGREKASAFVRTEGPPAVFVVCAFGPQEFIGEVSDQATKDEDNADTDAVRKIRQLNWTQNRTVSESEVSQLAHDLAGAAEVVYPHFKSISDRARAMKRLAIKVANERMSGEDAPKISRFGFDQKTLTRFLWEAVKSRIVRILLLKDFPEENDHSAFAVINCLQELTEPHAGLYVGSKEAITRRRTANPNEHKDLPMGDFALIHTLTKAGTVEREQLYVFDFYDGSNLLVTSGCHCADCSQPLKTGGLSTEGSSYKGLYSDWLQHKDDTVDITYRRAGDVLADLEKVVGSKAG